MDSDFDFGPHRRLFLAREAAKLKQAEAAEQVGMTRSRLGRCEAGRASPTLQELKNLCILYGVTPSYVVLGASVAKMIGQALRAASAKGLPDQGAQPEQRAENNDRNERAA